MFSPCGRSFCYGDPSLRLLTRTIVDDEYPLEGVNCDQLVEDHKRSEIDELNKKHDALQEQLHGEKAREKKLKDILKQRKNDGEDSFVVVSPPSQGDGPFLHNTSNENADESDNHALITFSPSNQH
ncbi:agamous-like MADS-box protein AGL23 [Sesbania bispinosa]|nr:agamous-like MADS-box protein AGL23 [Sesbania bispinosa]